MAGAQITDQASPSHTTSTAETDEWRRCCQNCRASQRAAAIALAAEKAARRVTRVPAAAAAEVTRLTERLPPAGARKQDMKFSDKPNATYLTVFTTGVETFTLSGVETFTLKI